MNTKTLVLTNPKGEKVKVLPDPIGYLDNQWRQRKVTIYQVADCPELVVSVGVHYTLGAQVIVQEAKTLYESTIAKFPSEEVFQ